MSVAAFRRTMSAAGLLGPAVLASTLLLGACDAVGGSSDLLARAGRHELTVEQAAGLLAAQRELPNQPEVVEALANLWIDYTLLARAAREDSALAGIDLDPVVRQQVDQELVFRLREQVITVDTVVTEEQARALYDERQPGAQVRARHILLSVASDATDMQRDSVRSRIDGIRQRALAGEDFAALAEEFSDDPGSASRGGDLGFFGRGDMVPAFDQMAFSLQPGQISEPVETPFGLHVIKVEEKRAQSFDEVRSQIEAGLKNERVTQAESAYVASVVEPANVTIAEGAAEAVRGLASSPLEPLSRRAGSRALANYEGGEYTAAEFQGFLQNQPPAARNQIASAADEQIDQMLRGLTRSELLVNKARTEGIDLSEAERDSVMAQARNRFSLAARQLGLVGITPEEGESVEAAIDRTVMSSLREILQGERDVIPLGPIAYTLREAYRGQIYEHAVPRVVERITAIQTSRGDGGFQPPTEPQRAPNAPPGDSAGR